MADQTLASPSSSTESGPCQPHNTENAAGSPAALSTLAYRWLGGLFARELTADTLRAYQLEEGEAFLALLEQGTDPAFGALVTDLRRYLQPELEADETFSGHAMKLSGDFSRLFLGAGGRRSAPPYQSAYSGETTRLYGEPVAQMGAVLRSLTMALPEDFPEPTDHISVQFDVMAALLERRPVAEQLDFISNHLDCWLPAFADRCTSFDTYGFYALAARAATALVQADKTRLAELVDDKHSDQSPADKASGGYTS